MKHVLTIRVNGIVSTGSFENHSYQVTDTVEVEAPLDGAGEFASAILPSLEKAVSLAEVKMRRRKAAAAEAELNGKEKPGIPAAAPAAPPAQPRPAAQQPRTPSPARPPVAPAPAEREPGQDALDDEFDGGEDPFGHEESWGDPSAPKQAAAPPEPALPEGAIRAEVHSVYDTNREKEAYIDCNGAQYYRCKTVCGKYVSIFKHDKGLYPPEVGQSVTLIQKGDFWNLWKPAKKKQGGKR